MLLVPFVLAEFLLLVNVVIWALSPSAPWWTPLAWIVAMVLTYKIQKWLLDR
jgi:type IV secretory pathway VirB2 component (pilin)